jgi:hypothetical protein
MKTSMAIGALALAAIAGLAQAQVTPPYTLPAPPTAPRAGTLAAIADNSNQLSVFGPAVTWGRTAGSSYSGLGTTVMGTTLVPGTNTTTPILGTARPRFGSSARLLGGIASSATTVSMEWRTATEFETYGSSTSVLGDFGPGSGPPMPDSEPWSTLGSDVVRITGVASTGPVDPQGRLPTDTFVLEMTFDPGIMVAAYQNYDTLGWTINDIINADELLIGYYDTTTGVWTKDVNVINPGAQLVNNYAGSWSSFVTTFGVTDANLSQFVGSYGVEVDSLDPTNSRTWAILDHNSNFAVVPTPGAAALLGLGGLLAARRRR